MKFRCLLIFLTLLFTQASAQPRSTSGLDGIICHVGFADNRGDVLDYVEYKGKRYEPAEAADALISKIGWKRKRKRDDIAWAWVTQVCMVGNTVLKEEPEEWAKAKAEFETPKVHLFDDGSVEVVLWYRDPVGMIPGHHYSKRSYKFSPKGKLVVEPLDDVSIP